MLTNYQRVLKEMEPTAYITKNKQRLKQSGNNIYLKGGDEFELELYNPSTDVILATILINGNPIGSGIVLRPAERVFLDRYPDEPKKFIFDTYEVDSNSPSAMKAIENNGKITVSFSKEEPGLIVTKTTYNQYPWSAQPYYYLNNLDGVICQTSANSVNYNQNVNYNNYTSVNSLDVNHIVNKLSGNSRKIETGRVEKGSASTQKLKSVSHSFQPYSFHSVEWRLMPESRRDVTIDGLVRYCTSCGRKKRSKERYCPSCGNKF